MRNVRPSQGAGFSPRSRLIHSDSQAEELIKQHSLHGLWLVLQFLIVSACLRLRSAVYWVDLREMKRDDDISGQRDQGV